MAEVTVDGRCYNLEVCQSVVRPVDVPRLVVVAHQPNKTAQKVLRVCVQAIQRFTPEPHVLWVVDNNSPSENVQWLLQHPDINVILNRTEPIPPMGRSAMARFIARLRGRTAQRFRGSYANAIGLELAVRSVDPGTKSFMSLHMDTMPCRTGWLSFLLSKMEGNIAACGVRMDRSRH